MTSIADSATQTTVSTRLTGHTRWRRLAVAMVPTLLASAALCTAMARGALAASFGVSPNSFTVSGESFQISASTLDGQGFVQFGVLDRGAHASYPEALSGIRSADLYDLCQSVVQDVPVLGPVTLRLTSGSGGTPAHADRLVADSHDLQGDALFHNINIGQDAATVQGVPGVHGEPGGFGEQADTVRIDNLRQQTRSVSAATFRLPGLHLSVQVGSNPCFDADADQGDDDSSGADHEGHHSSDADHTGHHSSGADQGHHHTPGDRSE
ncbi:DUF6230 family protein [Streptomyces sp. NRRL S-646]|uniref:DUF6230 family protein n=1 Tax=Streptomyces sp. NRRL S-646 TaxID=1463917 RepID=UPI0006908213|nr:DUF6230 family protein [Streptomyces sp. NRRL S-646]